MRSCTSRRPRIRRVWAAAALTPVMRAISRRIVAAHVVQDERPRLDLVDRVEVREHAPQGAANHGFARPFARASGRRRGDRGRAARRCGARSCGVECACRRRAPRRRSSTSRASSRHGSVPTVKHDLDHRLLRQVAAVRVGRAEEAADRAVDLRAQPIVQGGGSARISAAERGEQLAVVERGQRGSRPRWRGAGNEP